MTILHPLFTLGLHFVPLLLLRRVEERADLCVAGFVDLHHFGVAILLRVRSILAQALHLGALGLKCVLHFGLLIGGELKLFGQFLGALGGIGRSVVPATVVMRGRGLLVIGRAILSRRERRGDRNESGRDKNEQALLEQGNRSPFQNDLSTSMNGIMNRKLRKKGMSTILCTTLQS